MNWNYPNQYMTTAWSPYSHQPGQFEPTGQPTIDPTFTVLNNPSPLNDPSDTVIT